MKAKFFCIFKDVVKNFFISPSVVKNKNEKMDLREGLGHWHWPLVPMMNEGKS
jgi:hypothetical protein